MSIGWLPLDEFGRHSCRGQMFSQPSSCTCWPFKSESQTVSLYQTVSVYQTVSFYYNYISTVRFVKTTFQRFGHSPILLVSRDVNLCLYLYFPFPFFLLLFFYPRSAIVENNMYRCYSPHRSRDSLSPVCEIFSSLSLLLQFNILNLIHCAWLDTVKLRWQDWEQDSFL